VKRVLRIYGPKKSEVTGSWTKLLAKYYQNNQINDEMGRECSVNGRVESFGRKT
jgi:hypothetical protein